MREETEVLVDPLRPQLLDRRRGRGVQLSPPALQQRPVRDLLDQRVREPHLVRLPVAFEQTRAHQLVRLRHGDRTRPTARAAAARPPRPSTDAAVITSRAVASWSASSRARITFSIVFGSSTLASPSTPRPVADERAGPDERADQLGQEERDCRPSLDDAFEQISRDRAHLRAARRRARPPDRPPAARARSPRCDRRGTGTPRPPRSPRVVNTNRSEACPRHSGTSCSSASERSTRPPSGVLDRDDGGTAFGQRRRRIGGSRRAFAGVASPARARGSRRPSVPEHRPARYGHRVVEIAREQRPYPLVHDRPRDRLTLRELQRVQDQVSERQVRRGRSERHAATLEPRDRRARDVSAQLLDQPALADAWVAEHDQEPALAGERAVGARRRPFELALAPDHRRRSRRRRVRSRRSPTTSNAETGSSLPFSRAAAPHPTRTGRRPRRRVTSPTRTPPGGACDCRRAAVFSASPVAPYSIRPPPPIGPRTTSPVSMPTRTDSVGGPPPPSVSRTMRSAARIARSASSSCVIGAPKSARMPSPARSLTVHRTPRRRRPCAERRRRGPRAHPRDRAAP